MNAFSLRGLLAPLLVLLIFALPVHAQDPVLADPSAEAPEDLGLHEEPADPAPGEEPIDPALADEPQDPALLEQPQDPAPAAESYDAASEPAEEVPLFSQAELDQMLAPVALYPDELLSQLLMAATYPLEVVEAARWSRAHTDLKGQDAVRAVDDREWDPSIKAMVAFPDLLQRMDTDLDWTKRLGDAFLAQQDQVMDTVQDLRQRAEDAGNLEANDHVEVQHDGGTIVMHDRYPDVAYVPYYSPYEVYGTWWWPAYRPVYWDPWYGYYSNGGYYWWGPSIWIGSGFYYSHCDWYRHEVRVVHTVPFYYRRQRPVNDVWVHEYRHRRGVPYRDQRAHARYAGANARPPHDDRPQRAASSTANAAHGSNDPVTGSATRSHDSRRAGDRSGVRGENSEAHTTRNQPNARDRHQGTPAEGAAPAAPAQGVQHEQGDPRAQTHTQPRQTQTERRDSQPSTAQSPAERSHSQPSTAQSPPERSHSQPSTAQRPAERSHSQPSTAQRPAERSYSQPSTAPRVPERSYSRPAAPQHPAPAERSYSRPAAPQPSAPSYSRPVAPQPSQPSAPVQRAQPSVVQPEPGEPAARSHGSGQPRGDNSHGRPQASYSAPASRAQRSESSLRGESRNEYAQRGDSDGGKGSARNRNRRER